MPNKSFAIDNDYVLLFSVSSNKTVRLGAVNSSDKSIRLNILDENQTSFYEKIIKSGDSIFDFCNLSNLPAGKYKLVLSRGKIKEERIFRITEENIQLLTTAPTKIGDLNVSINQ
jgi:hypothetical protein